MICVFIQFCGKTFDRFERYNSHILMHQGIKLLACPVCKVKKLNFQKLRFFNLNVLYYIVHNCEACKHFDGSRYGKNGQNGGYSGLLSEKSFQNK